MKTLSVKFFIIFNLLMLVSNLIYAQEMKTEDDVVRYLDNAKQLDLVEGIYHDRLSGNEYWRAVVYNKSTNDFLYYDIDSKSRRLMPFVGKNETHLVRASKYANVFYAYVIINGVRYESTDATTFDSQNSYAHWCCITPDEWNWHVTLELKNKVYPKKK